MQGMTTDVVIGMTCNSQCQLAGGPRISSIVQTTSLLMTDRTGIMKIDLFVRVILTRDSDHMGGERANRIESSITSRRQFRTAITSLLIATPSTLTLHIGTLYRSAGTLGLSVTGAHVIGGHDNVSMVSRNDTGKSFQYPAESNHAISPFPRHG
jgi:hypothetical protein